MRNIAIVTGASSGIGREFCRQLDARAGGPLDKIWAIARRADRLEALASECTTPVRTFALDLTDGASFDVIDEALAEDDEINVQWLVNAAGFGKFGDLGTIGAKGNAGMVKLNCLAVVEMCYRCLLHMHAGSRIINMASVAALVPQPGLAVYSASKRFVLDLSRSLDMELGDAGIHVTAVCPKFMNTEFLDRPGDADALSHMTWIGFESPQRVVEKAIHAAVLGFDTCIPSVDMKLVNLAAKVLPTRMVMDTQRFVGNWVTQRIS